MRAIVFSSLTFLFIFLPITLVAYFSSPRKWKNLILFLLSLVFYAWGEPIYIFLLIISTFVDFFIAKFIDKKRSTGLDKLALLASICINLSILSVFKYSGFIVDNINALFNTSLANPDLPLPIGISFYTFQTLSYTIDVYRNKVSVQNNFINFGAYVAMFPQLVAGPIVRYETIEKQLASRTHTVDLFGEGARKFTIGLAKKVLLANNIGYVWSEVQVIEASSMSVALAWFGIIAFAFQIYFDFSGYSDMAIGLGLMFGFRFLENFNYPYVSRSITNFWRRWHISLGTWLREYVYIPLGGNRKGLPRQLVNIAIVWALTGFWHGASWNFVLWGVYFGMLLALEKLFLLKWLERTKLFNHLYVIIAVLVGWVLFSFESMQEGWRYLRYMFGASEIPLVNEQFYYYFTTYWPFLIVLIIASTPLVKWLQSKINKELKVVKAAVTVALLCLLLASVAFLVDSTYNPFLYFRF